MFDDALAALAPRGQLLIIGMMSQYADGWQPRQYAGIAEKLLWKSASLRGFFLLHHAAEWRRHLQKLAAMLQAGKLRVQVCGGLVAWGAGREMLAMMFGVGVPDEVGCG
jgi:NADPH-dependent curcumin reductase CurA